MTNREALLLFLDFDGVLHTHFEIDEVTGNAITYHDPNFVHVPLLVELLWSHLTYIEVVVSSTWGRKRSLDELRALLPAELAGRVVDAVHHRLPRLEHFNAGDNHLDSCWAEIARYLERTRPDISDRWLAIDDDDYGWPSAQRHNLAHCNRDLGDPASQAAVEHALCLHRAIRPFSADAAALRAAGEQPGAVGLDDAGELVQRGKDGQPHPILPKE